MARFDLFLKVEVESEVQEDPQRFAEELCRILRRTYGVRSAELSSYTEHPSG